MRNGEECDLLELRRFSVSYPDFRLGPFSVTFSAGERVALLGANGAGKSTTLRAVGGRLSGYRGRIVLEGEDLGDLLPRARARIGFLPERFAGFDWMTAREHLEFLSGFFPTWDRRYEQMLVRRLELPLDTPFEALSRGERVKLAFVAAEAYRPPVLLLDEPVAGVDPLMRETLLALLDACVPGGGERLVVFSSHLLEDVARLADRILLLDRGRLRTDTTREELSARFPAVPLSRALYSLLATTSGPGATADG